MVASRLGAADSGAADLSAANSGTTDNVPAGLRENKPSQANCGPMTQQGMMGAHGREMYPQGFLRLIGCHESTRQKEDAAPRLHA
jgi:hypothetical protein